MAQSYEFNVTDGLLFDKGSWIINDVEIDAMTTISFTLKNLKSNQSQKVTLPYNKSSDLVRVSKYFDMKVLNVRLGTKNNLLVKLEILTRSKPEDNKRIDNCHYCNNNNKSIKYSYYDTTQNIQFNFCSSKCVKNYDFAPNHKRAREDVDHDPDKTPSKKRKTS